MNFVERGADVVRPVAGHKDVLPSGRDACAMLMLK